MPLFHHILFPVDFSKRNHAVAPAVRAMAVRNHATLSLLHTFELPVAGYGDSYAWMPDIITEFHASSDAAMDKFAADHFAGAGIAIEKIVQCGAPVESVVEYVDKAGVDLVMLPSHGRSRFRSLLLGSVTAGVLHDTHCPVWTATHTEETPPPAGDYASVVCATDLTPKSIEVLRFAKRIACENKARLTIVYSESTVEDVMHSASAQRFRRFLEFRAREEYEPLAQQANLTAELDVVTGPIGESIAESARLRKADVLIIGRGVIEEPFGRLRTAAYDIIRNAPCPVISV
jgi:nucleotide-binding universal stress UspA family protein